MHRRHKNIPLIRCRKQVKYDVHIYYIETKKRKASKLLLSTSSHDIPQGKKGQKSVYLFADDNINELATSFSEEHSIYCSASHHKQHIYHIEEYR